MSVREILKDEGGHMSISLKDIKQILIEHIPVNKSEGEVILSVGESILLIMQACEKGQVDKSIMDQLNILYIEGVKTDEDEQFIEEIKEFFKEKSFVVKSDPQTINEDPTRRYFETVLAFHILQENAQKLENRTLHEFTQNLKKRLFSLSGCTKRDRMKVEMILSGEMNEKVLNKYQLEYAELIHQLLKGDYQGLSETACKNLYEIACSTILATMNTQFDKTMPVDIYSDSIFTMGMDGRGRIVKQTNADVQTTVKGLMKSTTPAPMYYDVVNPVQNYNDPESRSAFQRSADQANFMIESDWSQRLFSRQTQVYSNGISSTTLAQLRNIILQKRLGNSHFQDSLQQYMTVFAAIMLYNSGGHSFFEIFEVLKLPQCGELTRFAPGIVRAIAKDNLMYKCLCEDQKIAYDIALKFTQEYTRTLLNKKILNAQYKQGQKSGTTEPEQKLIVINRAVINQKPEEFRKFIIESEKTSSKTCNSTKWINIGNNKGWTALMIAAQLGKVEHVKILLEHKANFNIRADGLSALDLAIKSQKHAVVQVLLEEKVPVRISDSGGLKARSPALYFACRQGDMRILQLVLNTGAFYMADIQEALLTAMKVENLDALNVLFDSVRAADKIKYFTENYKSKLLKEAVNLGNNQLMQKTIDLNICPSSNTINYELLLNTAAKRGFLPIARSLLALFRNNSVNHDENRDNALGLDNALVSALKNRHFDAAVFFIIQGADPKAIPNNATYLQAFDTYLRNAQYNALLFAEEDMNVIAQRASTIEKTLNERQSDTFYNVIKHLVDFLNAILSTRWRLGYNDKTSLIGNISTMFNNHAKRSQKVEKALEDDNSSKRTDESPNTHPSFFSTEPDADTAPGTDVPTDPTL